MKATFQTNYGYTSGHQDTNKGMTVDCPATILNCYNLNCTVLMVQLISFGHGVVKVFWKKISNWSYTFKGKQ